jgi:hypothetical protein
MKQLFSVFRYIAEDGNVHKVRVQGRVQRVRPRSRKWYLSRPVRKTPARQIEREGAQESPSSSLQSNPTRICRPWNCSTAC